MTTYTITAANRFFWQDLRVQADTAEAALTLFRSELAGRDNIDAEEYEHQSAVGNGPFDDGEKAPDRADYVYKIDERDMVDGDESASATVEMVASGGNG